MSCGLKVCNTVADNDGEYRYVVCKVDRLCWVPSICLHMYGICATLACSNLVRLRKSNTTIDYSQCTLVKSRPALELLERDVKNVLQYFRKIGLDVDAEEIVAEVIKN